MSDPVQKPEVEKKPAEAPEIGVPPKNPIKEKKTPIPDTIEPGIKEDPESDNTARPPGDWQVEPDPLKPPGVTEIY
jgi:hypothetical protein